jgi:hypothetical protein
MRYISHARNISRLMCGANGKPPQSGILRGFKNGDYRHANTLRLGGIESADD